MTYINEEFAKNFMKIFFEYKRDLLWGIPSFRGFIKWLEREYIRESTRV